MPNRTTCTRPPRDRAVPAAHGAAPFDLLLTGALAADIVIAGLRPPIRAWSDS